MGKYKSLINLIPEEEKIQTRFNYNKYIMQILVCKEKCLPKFIIFQLPKLHNTKK